VITIYLLTHLPYNQAYVSVYYDVNRATITCGADDISDLTRRLHAAGISASEIGLYGRFHSSANLAIVDELIAFCNAHNAFRLPHATSLVIPTRSNDANAALLKDGPLHAHALRSILVEPPSWFDAFGAAIQDSGEDGAAVDVLSFGLERSVPPSLALRGPPNVRVVHLSDQTTKVKADRRSERTWMDSDIAVVGMSCKVPGANSLDEFWDILVAGRSQHREIDPARFSFEDTPFRTSTDANMNRKWFANLIEGHDQFDHRFFKKSARESASMDPQQRQLLQVAYQAVEQSGYFQQHFEGPKRIGCFVGVCLGDYDNNVASHAANAFTATGNLQGFISGKVSHFFGWTGPALTINTACSSSLVAVHQACQSILSGECDGALAGGSHVMTSAEWFQNLAAGSFLSPTGQCKPFDMKADGYCRGEGVGAVFLKKMSKAVADGDPILGVIAASAVQQNQNCTPIFVPNVPSLGDLFTNVMAKAKVKPSQISVVEAHGTGTAVGDPAEYDSIRKALGGEVNRGSGKQLMVSSVKGLVGHMECTSGVISLIKVLLMMDKGVLPPQASFETVNPTIKASPADRMFIPTRPQPWDADLRAALINNYGASGSNASAVVLQAPDLKRTEKLQMPAGAKYPFWISGFDNKALARNVKALRNYLARSAGNIFLAGLSYNLAYQTNRTLDSNLIFTARSLGELDENLAAFDSHKNASSATGSASATAAPTVILCFGGQVSSYIGLDPQVYHSVAILRKHLDRVDAVIQSLACPSIFPAIFQRTPVADTVHLQTMLFAMQYACAQSWIDSGIRPASLVGHSFGELTALCIAGILSLEDTVKMIARRAALVRDAWGPDKGAMMAVEADLGDVKSVLADVNVGHADQPATIACFNGPRSFTLAGPTSAIDHVAARFEDLSAKNKTVKFKRLKVTNAFHSVLVDAIYDDLLRTAEGLTFRKPAMRLELATEEGSREPEFTARFVADHMRKPVYFHHAVERLARRYSSGPCIFLEAGTNSTITSMAARALAHVNGTHTFHGVNMANCDDGWNKLTDVTMSLWRAGLRTQHWAHHGLQRRHQLGLKPLLLPPYQFDPDARHWMELKAPPKVVPRPVGDETESSASVAEKQPEGPLTFCGFQDGDAQNQALFRVNTATDKYKHLLSGHVTMETAPILSATLQISFVMDAICSIHPEYRTTHRQPQIQDVQYKSPVCANSARTTWIEVTIESRDGGDGDWNFEVFSTAYQDQKQSTTKRMVHTIGKIQFRNLDDPDLKRQLARYERLFGHGRVSELLRGSVDIDEVLGNRTIYRLFSEIVDYGDEFRGLQKMIVRGNETAGHVVRLNQDPELWFDPHLADTFCQLGGLWINCVVDRGQSHVYLANGIDQWIRLHAPDKRPEKFDVFAVHHRPSEQLSLTDVFVFDAEAGVLVEVILGIAYVKIPKISMEKLLTSLTEPSWINKKSASRGEDVATAAAASPPVPAPPVLDSISRSTQPPSAIASTGRPKASVKKPKTQKTADQGLQGLTSKVKAIIADLSGLEVHEIKDDSELADLGIDSLAGMEMVHEIESTLKVKLPEAAILVVTDMPGLIKCVAEAVGITAEESSGDSDSDTSSILSSADSTTAITNTSLSTPSSESDKEDHPGHEADLKPDAGELRLPFSTVMEAFNETKRLTDGRVAEMGQTSYVSRSLPLQNELTVALTIEAFESLGAGFRNAAPGEQLTRIPHGKEHNRFVTYLYEMLEAETQIIKLDSGVITRTAVPLPQRRSRDIYDELNRDHPDQHSANELTYYAGENLARVLSGETDGVKLIFGSTQGRNLVSHWYAEWPLNRVLIAQMEDFFSRLSGKLPHGISHRNPLRILEMGAGTGGTTKRIVPLLARLQVPVEYTFTDLAPSFVSAARKTWGKQYPWMKFRAQDIEKAPEKDLEGTQHFVIASNAIHATKSIAVSTANVRKVLRPDGFLVMMEMTRTPYWVDLIFGLFEGWWLFEDGRRHALTHESRWEKDLRGVGFGCVDWTDGERPESAIQRVIVAAASGNGSENSR
jgi:acyl transferase domain-containing protein/acyl carrier protein/SAM-dependent methyltransferase